jgi:SAM-dependent methyltransferase
MFDFGPFKASGKHAYLDCFSVVGRSLFMEGWADHFSPKLWYAGQSLPINFAIVKRPDLVPIFGPGSENWGFVLCALLPEGPVDRQKFRFRFSKNLTMDYPAERFSAASDRKFVAMTQAFRDNVSGRGGSLLEIGSRARSGRSYRDWFPASIRYVGMDISEGPNVDVVADAHHMSRVVTDKFDFIFSIAVFEHLLMPWKVALEMNAVLNDGGQALIISHGAWPLHETPWDFWRFSKEAWSAIFNMHTGFRVDSAEYQYPARIVAQYLNDAHFEAFSESESYLLSGCVVTKTAMPRVAWDADVSDIYNLTYTHG